MIKLNINKDGKTLYFSDEEIANDTNGEKKVFVTKRINGEESHIKAEEVISKSKDIMPDYHETFDFSNEIVIGVNKRENNEEKTKKNIEKKNKKNTKKTKDKKNKAKQKKKKRKNSKRVIVGLTSFLLIVIVAIFALTAPIFNITNIEVEGNNLVTSDTIISLSSLKKGENIFRFNNTVIENIKENQYIDNVKLNRKLPGTVKILVKEREIKYQINLINSYAYIDANGYILENSTIKKDVPVLVGLSIAENDLLNKKRLDIKDLEVLNKISKVIDAAKTIDIENIITEVNVENHDNIVLYIESKTKKIYIGDTSNLTNKMLYVQRILEKEEGKSGSAFVNGDISSGFKPYFREE